MQERKYGYRLPHHELNGNLSRTFMWKLTILRSECAVNSAKI